LTCCTATDLVINRPLPSGRSCARSKAGSRSGSPAA